MANTSDFLVELGVEFKYDTKDLKDLTSTAKKLIEKELKIDIIDEKSKGQAEKLYRELFKTLEKAYLNFQSSLTTGSKRVGQTAQKEIEALSKAIISLRSKAGDGIFGEGLDKSVTKTVSSIQKINEYMNKYDAQLLKTATTNMEFQRSVSSAVTQLTRQDTQTDRLITRLSVLEKKKQTVIDQYEKGNLTFSKASEIFRALEQESANLSRQASQLQKANADVVKSFSNEVKQVDKVSTEIDILNNKNQLLKQTTDRVTSSVSAFSSKLGGTNGVKKWLDDFKVGLKNSSAELSGAATGAKVYQMGIQLLVQTLQTAVSEIKELNKVMTDVQMVSGATNEETMKMFKDYNALGKELSVTTKSVASGASEWLRQGRSQADTMDLIKASTIQATLANLDYSESTTLLTSTLNGYKMEAKDAMHIVDALVQVDFKAATSVQELATALQKTANTARTSGVDFERLVGYIGSVSEATRQAPELIGRAFRTMFSRMQGVAAGADIDEAGESLEIKWGMVA